MALCLGASWWTAHSAVFWTHAPRNRGRRRGILARGPGGDGADRGHVDSFMLRVIMLECRRPL